MSKSTFLQVNQRVLRIYDLLLQGKSRQHILRSCSDMSVSERQMDTYIKRATELIKEDLIKDKNIIKSTVLAKQLSLYDLAVGKGDYETARKVLADFSKLNDIDSPEKIDINSTNTNYNKDIKTESTENLLKLIKKNK